MTPGFRKVATGALMLACGAACSGDEGPFEVQLSSRFLRGTAPVTVTVASFGERASLSSKFRCRIIPAHADVGVRKQTTNGCATEISIVAGKTRLSRFELDPEMSVDIIVFEGKRRAGVLSTTLTFTP